jgi:hypothetical protein
MAANGFNDALPILILTLALLTFTGRNARVASYLALGLKQFANIFLFAYHVLRREWHEAIVTISVTLIFLSPFLVWDWRSAICSPILDMPPYCQDTQNLLIDAVHSRINFALWPVWIAAIFYPALLSSSKQFVQKIRTTLARVRTAFSIRGAS